MEELGYGVQVVQRLLPDQWQILRKLRLVGLAEVLGEDHDDYLVELAFDEGAWRSMIAAAPQFVANVRSVPAGFASLLLEPDREVEVSFLWVDPDYRGAGVAKGLMVAVADWVDRGGYRAGKTLTTNRVE
ncbi:MAG: GNAT family N-acetyltransferase [Segniliparus sp.]|uniref:GNAT family N-acetyltransferase n=1 Tax=Segniliparus sp. TaxID=2804064 RepID=UPI003F3278B4